jgi:hypothetical protein
MRKFGCLLLASSLCLATACSPRDFLTRRLAADLIVASDAFKAPQQFWLRTGVISNKEYISPEYLVLQRHGWISGTTQACPPEVGPAPCWDVLLTPNGVNVFRDLIPSQAASSQYFNVQAARRELLEISGISKADEVAEVEFRWKWVPLNAVGSALYNETLEYNSMVGFRHFDDGWRLIEGTAPKIQQGMDEALRNAAPAQ